MPTAADMSHHKGPLFVLFLSVGGVVAACSASGASDPDLSVTPSETEPGAVLPPGTPGSSGGAGSSGGHTDGGKPSKPGSDASVVDAAPPAPAVGATCAKADEIFARPCGACGTQEAICQKANPSDAMGKVSEYSACDRELAGGCVPGAIVDESCGNCGTHKKTCTKYCAWTASACVGEPANSCSAGTVAWTSAGCPDATTFRNHACSATCQWENYQSCSAPDFSVKVPAVLGGIASIVVPLSPAYVGKRVTGSCTAATGGTVSTTDKHTIAFVRVENPSAKSATVSAWNAQAPGGAIINTVLVGYAAKPTTDEALAACEKGAGDYCNTASVPCGNSKFGALTEANALVIPAGASRVVAITSFSPHGTPGEVTDGQIVLGVRTDGLD
ncbi:MAG: hypothetical protein JWP87_1932 [Labilithrix sp.]|nr:hypothetical protein [Labilithrix sp.]